MSPLNKRPGTFPDWPILILIIVLGGSVLSAIAYFVAHLADTEFRNAAMADLFATSIGVLIGIPIALAINQYLQSEQAKQEQEAALIKDKALLGHLFSRLETELQANLATLKELQRKLGYIHGPDIWAEYITIVTSFEFAAYDDFSRASLRHVTSFEESLEINESYRLLRHITNQIRQKAAEDKRMVGSVGDDAAHRRSSYSDGFAQDSNAASVRIDAAINVIHRNPHYRQAEKFSQ